MYTSVVKQTSKEDKVVAVEEHLEEHHEENKTMNRQYFVQFESLISNAFSKRSPFRQNCNNFDLSYSY